MDAAAHGGSLRNTFNNNPAQRRSSIIFKEAMGQTREQKPTMGGPISGSFRESDNNKLNNFLR